MGFYEELTVEEIIRIHETEGIIFQIDNGIIIPKKDEENNNDK